MISEKSYINCYEQHEFKTMEDQITSYLVRIYWVFTWVIFLGPYQCEICQEITDTKQQFVQHIKSLHKDMVDEQVLR